MRPVNEEFAIADTILDPVEAHVDGLGLALFDGVIGNAGGAGVVSLDMGASLWMAKFFKGNSERAEILEIEESGAKFSFGGRGDNGRDDGAMDINGAIDRRWWIIG